MRMRTNTRNRNAVLAERTRTDEALSVANSDSGGESAVPTLGTSHDAHERLLQRTIQKEVTSNFTQTESCVA